MNSFREQLIFVCELLAVKLTVVVISFQLKMALSCDKLSSASGFCVSFGIIAFFHNTGDITLVNKCLF